MASQTAPMQYAAEELAAVAQLLGAPAFPGVDGLGDPIERDASLRTARRSLLARSVLELDDEGILSIAAPHALLFGVALAPAVTILAQRSGAETESRAWYVHPNVAVEHTVPIGAVHGLGQIESTDVVPRLLDFLGVEAWSSEKEPASFDAPRELLDRVVAALRGGESAGLGADLPDEAAPFFDALGSFVASGYVRVLRRDGPKVVGGELSWLDTGAEGLWVIEPVPADPGRIEIRRTAFADLVAELLSYLPGGDAQAAT